MTASVDIRAQLASIIERFASGALLEMSRAVDQEITRRQMELETLIVKLQFTENELRAARQQKTCSRSVGIQVNDYEEREVKLGLVRLSGGVEDASQMDNSLAPAFTFTSQTDMFQTFPIKQEQEDDEEAAADLIPGSDQTMHWISPVSDDFPATSDSQLDISDSNPVLEELSRRANDRISNSHCPQCGKSFTSRFYLKIHRRIHTGERPYGCDQCGKRFYCNSHLISHQRLHTGEKPYSCEDCGRSFSHLNSLKLHQRTHGEDQALLYC